MPDKPSTVASDFIAALYGAGSSAPVFLCALPNEKPGPRERFVLTRDRASIDGFVGKWDRAGSAIYFCTGTLRADSKPDKPGGSIRLKTNVAEILELHSDTDLKSIEGDRDALIAALLGLEMPPSVIVWSGNGAHAYWLLNEALEADPDTIARVEAMNAQLAGIVAGDAVQDVCRLLRLPGSHNTKDGAWREVEVVHARYEPRYELSDLEEWLDRAGPAIRRKDSPRAVGGRVEKDVWQRIADQFGFKVPIDVEARLAEMSFKGPGESSIHSTQLSVSSSLLSRGTPVEEVVETVLQATRAAAGADGQGWRWDREEQTILKMCQDWVRKHPETVPRPVEQPPKAQARQVDRDETQVVREGSTGAVVHHIAEERSKREKKPGRPAGGANRDKVIQVVVEGVLDLVRQSGCDIILNDGSMWLYEEGVWRVAGSGDEQWLRTLIQSGCEGLGNPGDTKTANAAWKLLSEHPGLYRRKVEWDAGGLIVTANGTLDLLTRQVGPWRPDAWCRAKIGVPYEAGATCPTFLRFLAGCFADKEPDDAVGVVATLQEAFGAMIAVRTLIREQRKALFLLGPSRTGKTQVSTIARKLIGEPVGAPSVVDISADFGMQMLETARAWIRDDAVSEQDKIDPARFKAIITGETVSVNRKQKTYAEISFAIPVLLTTNAMPRARDSSDAIYNRSLVLEMTRVVGEREAAREREALGLPANVTVGEAIAEREGPGILNWALDGLDRLRARGHYDPPEGMQAAIKRFRDDNNPVAAWAVGSVEVDPETRVARKDLLRSFNGWQREEYGAEARTWGGKAFFQAARSVLPGGMAEEYASLGTRYVVGVRLTEAGKRQWEEADNASLDRADDVNRHHEPAPKKVILTPRKTEF